MTTLYDELELVRGELSKCMKCGNCMAVCPVYIADKAEAGVARGKIVLAEAVLAGEASLDDEDIVLRLFNCLVCKSCMQICPSGVNFDRIMLSLRSAIVRKRGLHPLKRLIFGALKRRKVFDAGMKVGAAVQGVVLRRCSGQNAYSPRFPIGLEMRRVSPRLCSTTFRSSAPERITPPTPKATAAFFTGCSINYIYPQVGFDVADVLKKNHVEVIIPKEQSCCGMVVFAHGDVVTAREMARNNLDVFERTGAGYIVTACGSCGSSLQHEYAELLRDDPEYHKKAEYWACRTYDISTFLTKVIDYRRPRGKVDSVVTYHDPCHLKKTMGVHKEPRDIMKSIPGLVLNEMSRPDACCGGGGSYSITHYRTSTVIGRRKSADIDLTGARKVVTGCPACMMQLLDLAANFGEGVEVDHYIRLLAESYRKEES